MQILLFFTSPTQNSHQFKYFRFRHGGEAPKNERLNSQK